MSLSTDTMTDLTEVEILLHTITPAIMKVANTAQQHQLGRTDFLAVLDAAEELCAFVPFRLGQIEGLISRILKRETST